MSNISRLIYCSCKIGVDQISQDAMLLSIIDISRSRNAQNEITGALLSSPTHFFQILEGPLQNVTATMSRIRQDSRHDRIELVQFVPIEARFFSEWTMAVVRLKAPNGSLTADLLERVHAGDHRFVSVLQALAFKLSHKMQDATP